ncbi:MAG TPA: pitrilysin family protein [Candidatus Dormibacteraeota bacterium]|nr:pitrilysin family protein [Candidatus Dormibacteraeota bacterium]
MMRRAKRLPKVMPTILWTLALALAVLPAMGAALHLPAHKKLVLPNGLTILMMEQRGIPLVSFSVLIKAGATSDPPAREGLASVTAELLRKGTKTRTSQKFSADLDFIGGVYDAGASSDFTSLSAEFMAKDVRQGLDLLTDALLYPVFPQDEVTKILRQDIDGVRAEKDEARSVLNTYFNTYLYAGHPYGRPSGGDETSLAAIQRQDVTHFYETNYTPGNTIVAVAGDFQTSEMGKLLSERLAAWAPRKAPGVALTPLPPVPGKKLLLVDKPDSTQSYFAIGNVGIARTDPDRTALRVVNSLFGERFDSMINKELRIKSGLTYGAFSSFDRRKVPGPFLIFSYTRNETTAQAIDLTLQVLKQLHEKGLSEEDLASAKNYLKGRFPPSIETPNQLAELLTQFEFYGLDASEVNDFEARVDAVTPEVARRLIQKHYPLDNLVFVLIGKAGEIRDVVKKYAPTMDTRPIAEPGFWKPATSAPAKPAS